jgi:hypothetical protein
MKYEIWNMKYEIEFIKNTALQNSAWGIPFSYDCFRFEFKIIFLLWKIQWEFSDWILHRGDQFIQ